MFRAKLYVASVERQASTPDTAHVKFAAVTRGEENKAWAEATPAATFDMTIQNPAAIADLRIGQEFYVTFSLAEAVPSLADGHEYKPGAYEIKSGRTTWSRCEECNCKPVSHEEPLRSQIVSTAGL